MAGMNRQEMVDAISKGQAVSFRGRIISHVDDLPDEAEIAESVAEKKAALKVMKDHHQAVADRIKALEVEIEEGEDREKTQRKLAQEQEQINKGLAANRAGGTGGTVTNRPAGVTAPPLQPKNDGGAEGNDVDNPKGEDRVFAGRKLSVYRAKLDKAKPKDETEARKLLTDLDGVGDATAGHILDAIKENTL